MTDKIKSLLKWMQFRIQKTKTKFKEKKFRPYIKKKNVEGVVFDFWIGDSIGQEWYDLDCSDPEWPELRFIKNYLIKQGDVILECGAHHGCTTVVLANWVGYKGKVVAFEPVPKNADIIKKNIEINNIKNVLIERKAVGSREGRILITGESNSSVTNYKVGGTKVDMTYLDKYSYLNPSILKIDVEGFEVEVLKGAKNILKTKPKLAIEIHTPVLKKYNSSIEDLFDLIDIEMYTVWVQWQEYEDPGIYNFIDTISDRIHLFAIPNSF